MEYKIYDLKISLTDTYDSYYSNFSEKLNLKNSHYDLGAFYLFKSSPIYNNNDLEFERPMPFINQNEIYPIIFLPLGIHSAIYNEVTDEEAMKALM